MKRKERIRRQCTMRAIEDKEHFGCEEKREAVVNCMMELESEFLIATS